MKRALALVTLAGIVTGCSKVTSVPVSGGDHPWTHPGVLRVAVQADPKTLNPLLSSDSTDVFIDRFMFLPLIAPNAKGVQQPMLATEVPTLENGGVSSDGLTITYHLRGDAKWSDGVAVTSKDVEWSWRAIVNPANNIESRNGYDDVASIDTPNASTVVVHLKKRFAPFVNTFFTDSDQPYPVAPEHVLGRYRNINEIPFNGAPNVTDGPFKFGEWLHNDHISLIPNDGFFMGRPRLKRIDIKIVPDENTSVFLLKSHAIDWIFEASIRTYPELAGSDGIRIVWTNFNGYYALQMNTAHAPLNDVVVRRAIAYAIDKANLVKTAMYGQETLATEDIPDWMWAFDPHVSAITYNASKARALLETAGYTMAPNGVVEKDGHPLSLLLAINNSNVTMKQLAVQMQEQLAHVGIRVQIKQFPASQLYAPAGEGGVLQRGSFDLTMSPWIDGIDPDDSSTFMCKSVPPGGYNYTRYCSPEMDAAETMALSHYDQATRKAAFARIQTLLARDTPQVVINWLRQEQPVSVDFKHFTPNPVTENWNAWEWSI